MSKHNRNRDYLKARQRYNERHAKPTAPVTMAITSINCNHDVVTANDNHPSLGPIAPHPTQEPQRTKFYRYSAKQSLLNDPDWERQQVTAHRLSVSVRTLHRWIDSEGFPRPVKFGGVNCFERVEVDKWILSKRSNQRVG